MRNYAEELAYWYLRLNGFFPLTDFVLHNKSGDTDVLGIRAPFTSEYVKGNRLEEDNLLVQLIRESGGDLYKNFVCIIAETKGGKTPITGESVNDKFDFESLGYNLRRLGLFKENRIKAIAGELEKNKWLTVSGFAVICKVLFAPEISYRSNPNDSFSFISMEAVKAFLQRRMELKFKSTDWDKFNSEMIQELIMSEYLSAHRRTSQHILLSLAQIKRRFAQATSYFV